MTPRQVAIALLVTGWCAACGDNMQEQPRYDPLEASAFFEDGQSARHIVDGTVPRAPALLDRRTLTGRDEQGSVTEFPLPVSAALLVEGEERFNVYCAPCHSRTGDGDGMIVQRGFRRPPSFFEPRLMTAAPGHIYSVISNGFGAMPAYAYMLTVEERWAVAAYVRALQLLGSTGGAAAPSADGSRR